MEFAAGLVFGCLLGVAATLGILVLVAAIPREEAHAARGLSFSGLAAAVLAILAVTWFAHAVSLRDGSLPVLLLLIVLAVARLRGLRTGLATAAFAALVLCILFPPVRSLGGAQPQDQLLLAIFILSAALGSHLASGNSELVLRAPDSEAGRSARRSIGENVAGRQES